MEEEKIRRAKDKNRKIYPIYKMFSWDLLFYYPIIFLFLSQAKELTISDILLGDACYSIFKILFQPFAPIIVNFIGKRRTSIIGNIFVSLSILTLILLKGSLINYIITNLIMAIGFMLKGVCDSFILEESIEDQKGKHSKFTKIDSRGSVYFYIFEAISAIATGFLFVVDAYIPIYLCFIFCIVGTLISFRFEHYEVKKENEKQEYSLEALKKKVDLAGQEYEFILKSKRLRALLLFATLFYGVLYIRSTMTSSLLVSIGIPDKYFGMMSAIFTIFAAISTYGQHFIHKKLRNKLLTVFSLTYSISFMLIGITAILNLNYILTLIIIIPMMIIQNMIKGPYYVLIKRYCNSFSNDYVSIKIYSIKNLMESLGATIVSFTVSMLLQHINTDYASLIIGIVSFILFILILEYMKTRIGLEPNEYKKQDVEFKPKEYKKGKIVEIAIGLDKNGCTNIEVQK